MLRSRTDRTDGADPMGRAAAIALIAAAACAPAPVSPAAARCPERPVVLARRDDVARLAGCTEVPGVMLRTAAPLALSQLGSLTRIAGDLVIGPTAGVDEVALGRLASVGGAVRVIGNGVLRGLYLPRLEAAGRIDIDGNPVLAEISLPRLVRVEGALRITANASLELVDVSALAAVGGELVVIGAPRLALVEAARIERAAAVEIDAPELPADVTERLRAAGAPGRDRVVP